MCVCGFGDEDFFSFSSFSSLQTKNVFSLTCMLFLEGHDCIPQLVVLLMLLPAPSGGTGWTGKAFLQVCFFVAPFTTISSISSGGSMDRLL
jgi:hypothetical protein